MGWANEKKIFAAEVDDLKKKNKCSKKFSDEDEDFYDEEEDFESASEANGPSSSRRNGRPPDGGWGWVVLFASFMLNLIVDGIGFSYSQGQHEYTKVFNATLPQVSVVSSSFTGSYLIVGPIVGELCFHWGMKRVTIAGSLIAMAGFIASAFATNLNMMILTFGVIGGIGTGMMYLPSIVCVSYWFDKKLSIATGFAVFGSGIGQFCIPPLGEYLMNEYQWQGKHLIFGAIVFNGVVCGLIFRTPDRWPHKRQKPCNQRVEIERGIIMKALIEDKRRQRTISDGSLDNCVITTNNRLIKLEPSLFHCKKNQALRKMLRQLGYSIQSLAPSKTSLQPSNQQVLMEAIQQQRQQQQQQMNGSISSSGTNNSSLATVAGGGVGVTSSGQLQKRNSSPDFNKVVVMNGSATSDQLNGFVSRSNSVKSSASSSGNGSGVVMGGGLMMNGGLPILSSRGGNSNTNSPVKSFTKTRSCDALTAAQQQQQQQQQHAHQQQQQQQPYNMLIKKIMTERVRSHSECVSGTTHTHLLPPLSSSTAGGGSSLLGSSPALPVGSVDISIQEIPADEADNVVGSCYTSNTSLATDVSGQFTREYVPNSSHNSFVTCMISEQDLERSLKELSRQERRSNSCGWRLVYTVMEMVQLMCRPLVTVFLFSSFFTLLGMYIPFFYFPNLGKNIGMDVMEAEFLPIIISVTSTIGRLIVGWLGDRPWINPLYLNNGALLAAGLCCIILPSANSPELLCVLAAVLGFCLAVFVALRSVLLVKFLGAELIPKTFGLMCLFMGFAAFIGNPIAGELGPLDFSFYFAGLVTMLSGLVLFPAGYLKRREDKMAAAAAAAAAEEEEDDDEDLANDCNNDGYLMADRGAAGGVGSSPVHQCSLA